MSRKKRRRFLRGHGVRLLKGQYTNFGSYGKMELDFSDLGLTLISGPTGSGKSTLMDATSWCLFGTTSKDGVVDEVRSWGSDEVTEGIQEIEVSDGTKLLVTRRRGKPKDNDLFWTEGGGEPVRGKDATETQKLLQERLGVSAELYFTAAYFSQFSKADTFFTAKAKERRDVLEQVADLGLAVRIGDGASARRKDARAQLDAAKNAVSRLTGRSDVLRSSLESVRDATEEWVREQAEATELARAEAAGFESAKRESLGALRASLTDCQSRLKAIVVPGDGIALGDKLARAADERSRLDKSSATSSAALKAHSGELSKLSGLPDTCPTCLGRTSDSGARTERLQQLEAAKAKLQAETMNLTKKTEKLYQQVKVWQLEQAEWEKARKVAEKDRADLERRIAATEAEITRVKASVNTAQIELDRLLKETNPYLAQKARLEKDLRLANRELVEAHKNELVSAKAISTLTRIYDLSMELRGKLLEAAVVGMEESANDILTRYFDAEIKVEFILDGEKLDVRLEKNGYECSFRQLSGGQRCMLKLAFSVSLMRAASDKAGIHFSQLFFDEPLAGLDETLKVKAFGLFEAMEKDHESILVIDHAPEFKALFSSQFSVRLEGDTSELTRVYNG